VPNFDAMNETDVREIIVRPMLGRLGFEHGTLANIRTEVQLRYDRAFLGRKNPSKDPPLVGRADYICEAISYGRWIVEVKAPSHELTQDDVDQAHTYSAHPSIGAIYFILTNGREFRLYLVGKLDAPLMLWKQEDNDQMLPVLINILGYDAIKKRAEFLTPDVDKPLGMGLPSKVRIIGGEVQYGEHKSDHPLFRIDAMKGTVGQITGKTLSRANDGRLLAIVSVRSPYQQLADLNKLAGLEDYEFYCAEEFISSEPAKPTIFQNVVTASLQPGVAATILPGVAPIPLPFGFDCTVFTEAVGYTEGNTFKGVLSFRYDYKIIRGRPIGIPQVDMLIRNSPPTAKLEGEGDFVVNWARWS
jgi:hypothetical protein